MKVFVAASGVVMDLSIKWWVPPVFIKIAMIAKMTTMAIMMRVEGLRIHAIIAHMPKWRNGRRTRLKIVRGNP